MRIYVSGNLFILPTFIPIEAGDDFPSECWRYWSIFLLPMLFDRFSVLCMKSSYLYWNFTMMYFSVGLFLFIVLGIGNWWLSVKLSWLISLMISSVLFPLFPFMRCLLLRSKTFSSGLLIFLSYFPTFCGGWGGVGYCFVDNFFNFIF